LAAHVRKAPRHPGDDAVEDFDRRMVAVGVQEQVVIAGEVGLGQRRPVLFQARGVGSVDPALGHQQHLGAGRCPDLEQVHSRETCNGGGRKVQAVGVEALGVRLPRVDAGGG